MPPVHIYRLPEASSGPPAVGGWLGDLEMKRIESCPSIVDSVSFFDYDTSIADSFHADLTPLPGSPSLHPGASSCVPSVVPAVSSAMA